MCAGDGRGVGRGGAAVRHLADPERGAGAEAGAAAAGGADACADGGTDGDRAATIVSLLANYGGHGGGGGGQQEDRKVHGATDSCERTSGRLTQPIAAQTGGDVDGRRPASNI